MPELELQAEHLIEFVAFSGRWGADAEQIVRGSLTFKLLVKVLSEKFSRKFGHRLLQLVEVFEQLVILHEADWVKRVLEEL